MYYEDAATDMEAKAIHTWKYLIHAGRDTLSLEEFCREVNSYQVGAYSPSQLRDIHERLKAGEVDLTRAYKGE